MSPLRAVMWLLAVTLLMFTTEVRSAPNEVDARSEKVKRGAAPFPVSEIIAVPVGDRREFVLFFNDESTGIVLNNRNLELVELDNEGDQVTYTSGNVIIEFDDGNATTDTTSDITRFSYVSPTNLYSNVSDGDVITGAGTMYFQRPTALFVQSTGIVNAITQVSGGLPAILDITFAEVLVVTRITPTDNIVLNIDPGVGDGVPDVADDILELTGSSTIVISDNVDLLYNGRNVFSIAQAVPLAMDIANFYFLEPSVTTGSLIQGRSFEVFSTSNVPQRVFSGPGILRIGEIGGQNVAFYSTVADVNEFVSSELVRMSLSFAGANGVATITAEFPPSLDGTLLISLAGAQAFNFPTATSVSTSGSLVQVLSGSNVLQQFDLGQPPNFASFINHQVDVTTADRTYNIPNGGATLWLNPADNTYFLYPSRNQDIFDGINMAISDARIEQVIRTAQFSLASDNFGVVTLTLETNDDPSATFDIILRPSTVVDIPLGLSLTYKANQLDIIDNREILRRSYDMIGRFTVNLRGSEILSSEDTFFTSFGGPGRLYIGGGNGSESFYTQNVDVQNFITNFIQSLPQPRVNLVRETGTNNIFFQSGTENLLQLNGGTTISLPYTAIYFQNDVNFVETFDIPSNARAVYNSATNIVEVRDPNDPQRFLFRSAANLPASSIEFFNDSPSFQGDSPRLDRLQDTNNDFSFPFMNGMIYFSDTGVLVSSSDAINSAIYNSLFGTGPGAFGVAIERVMDVSSLTVADGSSIMTYSGGAPFVLPRGGTYYFSSETPREGIYFDTASYMSFLQGVTGVYTQLNPTSVSYNRTTGVLSLLTGERVEISMLSVGETVLTTIDQGISFSYENETIIFDDGTTQIGIDELRVWDGFQLVTFDRSVETLQMFSGPGLFWFVDENTAFFTRDASSVIRVQGLVSNVMGTFRAPILSRDQRTFTSKFSVVDGGFPQVITVYQGADVRLRCNVAATNPAATITFFERSINETDGQTITTDREIEIGDPGLSFSQIGNVATLFISDLQPSDESRNFVCNATNLMGSRALTTRVNVLPAQPPAIVNNFVPPLSFFTNSSDRLETVTADDNTNMLAINRRFYTIEGPTPSPGVVRNDDFTTIVRRIHIGCKAEGLPKSEITWYALPDISDTSLVSPARVLVNASDPNIDITVPRQGRSVLSVTLDQQALTCTRYICSATNAAGTVLGGTDICTQYYFCESGTEQGTCSVTCGIGIAPLRYQSCALHTMLNPLGTTIQYESIPGGLLPLPSMFCQEEPCPVEAFNFVRENPTICSVTCGCGVIEYDIVCQRTLTIGTMINETETVADSFCAGQRRPRDQERCFNPPCPSYEVTEFSPCSQTCRGGTQTREVTCVRAVFNDTSETMDPILDVNGTEILEVVNDTVCMDQNIRRPPATIMCNEHIACPFRYRVGPWNPCNREYPNCQTRDITCESYDPNDYLWEGEQETIETCENANLPRPHRIRSCGGGPCAVGEWMSFTNVTRPCSVTCGRGLRRVDVVCVNRTNELAIEEDLCNPLERPSDVQICVINCRDRCFTEPSFCPAIKIVGCDRPALITLAQQCCISCPKQATSITDPTPFTGGTVTAGN